MTTLAEMMRHIRSRLSAAGIEDPAAEARIIIGGLTGLTRTEMLTKSDMMLADDEQRRLADAVDRRIAGEPPYRILGSRDFYGLEFRLSKDTLEPRPDTEILVDCVLEFLKPRRYDALRILDLGTGTGAICLALLSELPNATGVGADLSPGAVAMAIENAGTNGLSGRFEAIRSNWFENISGRYDAIVSNPPYIRRDVIPTLDREVRDHDPTLALDGGVDGMDPYRSIAAGAAAYLADDGLLAVETGYDQHDAVRTIFEEKSFAQVFSRKDYAGNDRVQVFWTRDRTPF